MEYSYLYKNESQKHNLRLNKAEKNTCRMIPLMRIPQADNMNKIYPFRNSYASGETV